MGGGFGRRIKVDEVADAVFISKNIKKPVQVLWSREEDIQNDNFHTRSKASYQKNINNITKY